MENTDKQRAARQLITDHMRFLSEQESMVERIVDRKIDQMMPKIDNMIKERLREFSLSHQTNTTSR